MLAEGLDLRPQRSDFLNEVFRLRMEDALVVLNLQQFSFGGFHGLSLVVDRLFQAVDSAASFPGSVMRLSLSPLYAVSAFERAVIA